MEAILKRTVQRVHESEDEKLLIEQAQVVIVKHLSN